MQLTDEYEPIVLLNNGETYSGLRGCQLILLTHDESERVDDEDSLRAIMATEAERTFDLEDVVRWAFANGYAYQAQGR